MFFAFWYTVRLLFRRPAASLGIWWPCFTGMFSALAFAEILPVLSGVHLSEKRLYTTQLYCILLLCMGTLFCTLYTLLYEDFRQHRDEYTMLRRMGCRSPQLAFLALLRPTLLTLSAALPASFLVRLYGKWLILRYNQTMLSRPWQQTFAGTAWDTPWTERTFVPGEDWRWILPLFCAVVWTTGLLAWFRARHPKENKTGKGPPLAAAMEFSQAYRRIYRKRNKTTVRTTATGIVIGLLLPTLLFCAVLPSVPQRSPMGISIYNENAREQIPLAAAQAITRLPGVVSYEAFTWEYRKETALHRPAYDNLQLWLSDETWMETAQAVIREVNRWDSAAEWVHIPQISILDSHLNTSIKNKFIRLQCILLAISAFLQEFFTALGLLRTRKEEFVTLYRLGLSGKEVRKLIFQSIFQLLHPPLQTAVFLVILLYILFSYAGGAGTELFADTLIRYPIAAGTVSCYCALVSALPLLYAKKASKNL